MTIPSSFVCPPSAAATSASGPITVNIAANEEEYDNNGVVDHLDHAYDGNEEEDNEVDEATLASEEEIMKAGEHVKMARAQFSLVKEKIEQAKADRRNKVQQHSDRTYTLIIDYRQNMALPYFGESQPGDTYYFTPLNIYNLGVVDVSEEQDKLYCHIYQEGGGKKGGNNVVSLIRPRVMAVFDNPAKCML
jgi:hypothetical protein